jgi:hypothetical protein
MLMTGALCVIGQGSPAQPLVGCLFQLAFLLLVLKMAPFIENADDWSSFFTSLTLLLTTLGGFALVSDSAAAGANRSFDSALLSGIMVALAVVCIVFELGIMLFVDCNARMVARKLAARAVASQGALTTSHSQVESDQIRDWTAPRREAPRPTQVTPVHPVQ